MVTCPADIRKGVCPELGWPILFRGDQHTWPEYRSCFPQVDSTTRTREREMTLQCCFIDPTSSIVRSLINCITRSLIFIWLRESIVACSNTFVSVSTPPCSKKLCWAAGKFRSRVDRVKRRRKRIVWSTSVISRRDNDWTAPRFNPFDWTFGFLNRFTRLTNFSLFTAMHTLETLLPRTVLLSSEALHWSQLNSTGLAVVPNRADPRIPARYHTRRQRKVHGTCSTTDANLMEIIL